MKLQKMVPTSEGWEAVAGPLVRLCRAEVQPGWFCLPSCPVSLPLDLITSSYSTLDTESPTYTKFLMTSPSMASKKPSPVAQCSGIWACTLKSKFWPVCRGENLYFMAQDFSIIAKQQLKPSRSSRVGESAMNITEVEPSLYCMFLFSIFIGLPQHHRCQIHSHLDPWHFPHQHQSPDLQWTWLDIWFSANQMVKYIYALLDSRTP